MFACQHERVMPDIMILAKAVTKRYMSIEIILLTEQLFSTFSNPSEAEKTFYYGHRYTGNALAGAAAKARFGNLRARDPFGSARRQDRITPSQLRRAVQAIASEIAEVCGRREPA